MSSVSPSPALTLADGGQFPSVGLGMWKMPKPALPGLVQEAIKLGYRHLDCACDYGNELEVGAGITAALRDGLCRRDDLWVTSKLWNTYHEPKHVRAACERSLRDLGLKAVFFIATNSSEGWLAASPTLSAWFSKPIIFATALFMLAMVFKQW